MTKEFAHQGLLGRRQPSHLIQQLTDELLCLLFWALATPYVADPRCRRPAEVGGLEHQLDDHEAQANVIRLLHATAPS